MADKRMDPAGIVISVAVTMVAVVVIMPLAQIALSALAVTPDRWVDLLDDRIPHLLRNTLSLVVAVTFLSLFWGTLLAWLAHRTDVPGAGTWRWLLALPLAFPPYVGALAYISIFGPRGMLVEQFAFSPPDIYSFGGAVLILTAFTYPYVFLIVGSALRRGGAELEEAAMMTGARPLKILFGITLPLLRPALLAGGLLVSLYVLGDFGVVSLLRYPTFTSAIYFQLEGFDPGSAAVLSLVLVMLTMSVLGIKRLAGPRNGRYSSRRSRPDTRRHYLGGLRIPAMVTVLLSAVATTGIVLSVLIHWTIRGLASGVDPRLGTYLANSLMLGVIAASLTMLFSIPVAHQSIRATSLSSRITAGLCYAGYSIPGVIIGLGTLATFIGVVSPLYGTAVPMIAALFIRFLPQNLEASGASLERVSPDLEEAGRVGGATRGQVLRKITIPLMKPGVLAGGALVFVSSIKELPASLILRPAGFDTLAVRVWMEAAEGFYELAAPAALLIVGISLVFLRLSVEDF